MKKIFYLSAVIILVFSPLRLNAQNNALTFSSDYVSINSNLGLGTTNITGECWVNLPSTSEMGTFINIGDANTGYAIGVGENDFDHLGNELIIIYDMIRWIPTGVSIGTGWHHVAFNINNIGTAQAFLDGRLVFTSTGTGPIAPSNTSFIGSSVTVRILSNGTIDEVRLWSDVRTEAEIRANIYQEVSVSETNLIAYYKFNETSGQILYDATSNNYDGTLSTGINFTDHAVTSSAFFGSKNALNFDGGNNYVNISSLTTLSGAGTFSFWIKLNNIPTTNARIMSKAWNDDEIILDTGAGTINTIGFVSGNDLHSTNPLPVDVWTHVAITADGTSSKLFINGILNDTGGSADFSLNTVRIGGQYTISWEIVPGQIDEFRIWDDVRTEDEIRENMNKSLTGNEDGLVAYYNFDNGMGTSVTNIAGASSDGTVVGASWTTSTAFNSWLNTSSTSWATGANWSSGVPSSTDNIGIQSGNSNPSISGATTVNSLVIESGAELTVASNTLTNSGKLYNYGTLTGTGTIINNDIIDGTGNITNNGTFTNNGTVTTNDFTNNSSKTVTINAGKAMTINGTLTNAGNFNLLSPSNNGATGSLITNGTITNTGAMTMKRWISKGTLDTGDYNWHMISLPVASTQASTYFNGDYVYAYSESDNDWVNISSKTDMINRGQGYIVKTVDSDKTFNFSGTFNSGDYEVTVANNDEANGYNLVGNPYPSSIDVEQMDFSGISSTIYQWNSVDENWASYKRDDIGANGGSRYIHPAQGFMVRVFFGSLNLSFDNDDRTHTTGGVFFKKSTQESSGQGIRFKVRDERFYDEMLISFNDSENDGYKMFSMNPSVPQVFVIDDFEENFVFYNVSGELTGKEIKLGFRSDTEKTFTMDITELDFDTYDIFLRDELTASEIILEQGSTLNFSHSLDAEDHRFTLTFETKGTSRIEDAVDNWNWVYSENMNINVMTPGILNADISVMNINGQIITQFKANSDRSRIPISTEGLYLVKIVSNNQVSLKKIIVK